MIDHHPTVLIIDDAKINREVVRQCLDGHGYAFLEAANGAEALKTIRTQVVDLVILDLMMPFVDGFAVLAELKTDPIHASIPVIVNSSLGDDQSIKKALTLGSYDYFCKALPRKTLELLLPLKAKNAIESKRLLDAVYMQKKMLEKEIRAAGKYQRFLLPNNVNAKGMNIETLFHPHIGVGGDFFDFVPLGDGKTGMIIADVSGHGVLPAMITSVLKPLFSNYIRSTESPRETLKCLNADFLTLTDEADYITAFVGVYNPHEGLLYYANAGHPPSFHYSQAADSIDILWSTGVFLGVFGSHEWIVEERLCTVNAHDRLLMITDGVSEARSESGNFFGIDGLENFLRHEAKSGLRQTVEKLWQKLQEYTGNCLADDITCIAIDFKDETA